MLSMPTLFTSLLFKSISINFVTFPPFLQKPNSKNRYLFRLLLLFSPPLLFLLLVLQLLLKRTVSNPQIPQ